MIALSGQLGNGALGAFELGRPRTASLFVPHRGRARSALTAATVRSTVRAPGARSTISANTVRSEVSDE